MKHKEKQEKMTLCRTTGVHNSASSSDINEGACTQPSGEDTAGLSSWPAHGNSIVCGTAEKDSGKRLGCLEPPQPPSKNRRRRGSFHAHSVGAP